MPQYPAIPVNHGGVLGTEANRSIIVSGTTAIALALPASSYLKNIIFSGGVVGTGGNLVLNDCLAVADATAANQIITLAGTTAVGTVTGNLGVPLTTGLVVSAVPTGGTVAVRINLIG